MIKHMLLAGIAAMAVTGAVAQTPRPAKPAPVLAPRAAAAPMFGRWGFDVAGMDRTQTPGNSFFGYANGTWEKVTPIPADRSSWGGFGVLRDLSDERTRTIIEEAARSDAAPGTAARKVGDFYKSFMDEAAIERAGITPLAGRFAAIDAIRTRGDLARVFGEMNRSGISTPIGGRVGQDLKDNTQYGVYLGQGGLGLPDRDYYLDDSNPKFVAARDAYRTHVANMLRLAGMSDPIGKAKRIYDLEARIAATHWTRAQSRQVEKRYNPMSTASLGTSMPGLDWNAYLAASKLGSMPQVIVSQPSALTGIAALVASEPLDTWKEYLTFRTLSRSAGLLPKAFVEEDFAFFGKTLSGTPVLKERWKRGADLINGTMGEAVGELYVAKYFTPEAKAKMDALVRNLIAAMDARLANLEWMAPETKVRARAKLAAFTPKIGYPVKWRDYSALQVQPGDVVGNAMRATDFEYNRQLAKVGKPVDRTEWGMTPQTVNAYANPTMNEIVFPAAILQPPFFDPNADDAVNYGGIGMVIGHEISHHFDDQGRKFDAAGNLQEWWTPQDVARFKVLTDKVVAQYAGYEPLPGSHVNGELTLGENIADLAGLTVAYDAYRLSLKGKPAKVIDGYTGDQRFFLGFAQVWRNKYRDPVLLQQLVTDSHTPGHFRPNVVRNFDPWYTTFKPKPGEALYLAPKDRIRIW